MPIVEIRKFCTKKTNKLFAAVAFASAAGFTGAASATVFAIDYHDAGVWNAYDSDNEAYAMKYRADQGKDGFWLVLSDGNNPKGDGASNAILYGDIANNRITAYAYNGENSSSSFENGALLGTYENVFSSGGVHPEYGYELTMFSIDVSGINNALGEDFDGVQIGERAGIWFHQSAGSNFTYNADGSIADYTFDNQMWLDRGNDATVTIGSVDCAAGERLTNYLASCNSTQLAGAPVGSSGGGGSVPAPGGLALVLAGLAGLRWKLRNKKA